MAEAAASRCAGRPAGKRRATNWSSITRRKTQQRPVAALHADANMDSVLPRAAEHLCCSAMPMPQRAEQQPLELQADDVSEVSQLEQISRDLITHNAYDELFESERLANQQLLPDRAALAPSSYRRRLHAEDALKYDRRRRNQQRDEFAIALHANNQRHWSPSMIARSVAYFRKTNRLVRRTEASQRRLASWPTTLQCLGFMKKHRPQPAWKVGAHVKVFGYDQTYQWVGMKKRGRRQAVERLDGTGMPTQITHEVYINSLNLPLPAMLGTLSQVHICTHACIMHAYSDTFGVRVRYM